KPLGQRLAPGEAAPTLRHLGVTELHGWRRRRRLEPCAEREPEPVALAPALPVFVDHRFRARVLALGVGRVDLAEPPPHLGVADRDPRIHAGRGMLAERPRGVNRNLAPARIFDGLRPLATGPRTLAPSPPTGKEGGVGGSSTQRTPNGCQRRRAGASGTSRVA